LLRLLSKVCYGRRDVRAGWIGPGLPQTDYTEFKPLANWALQHWAMYSGFVSHAEVDDGDRILDVGCGTGHATVCLASVFPTCTIVGIDIDDLAVVFARSFNSGGNVCYVHSSFLDFWPSQRYAYIFALETLEHIQPARHYEFVDKCLGMLEEDGLLFLTTPNALDEADCTYGHVGLLNRVRARAFIHKYRKSIQNASFYDNQKLSSADPSRFIVEGPVDRFEDIERNRSHFQLVMRKT
jgi:2-polyprenyl-3-methyl-5-hydroxy-6-metoxy-1,4-benzoquinol methylase